MDIKTAEAEWAADPCFFCKQKKILSETLLELKETKI